MNSVPVVGIVTRTKDRVVLLRRAIESVLHQTYRHWIMVIVNDGGIPGDVEDLVENYATEASGRILVVHNPASLGMEGASKVGMEAIASDLLIVHDDDDAWAPEFLSVTIDELLRLQSRFPSVQGVTTYSHRVLETLRGNLVEIDSVEPYNDWIAPGLLSLDRMLAGNLIPPISFLFTRKAYEDLGSLYEAIPYLGDWGFLIRFLCRFDIYLIPQFLAFYHWRIRSASGGLGNTVTAEIDRHHFYKQLLLNAWLRQDLAAGKAGIGTYANQRIQFEHILGEIKALGKPGDGKEKGEASDLAEAIVDYYWESVSWRISRPLRKLINVVFRLPAEKKPEVDSINEAWDVARSLQESVSWHITAPVRLLLRLF